MGVKDKRVKIWTYVGSILWYLETKDCVSDNSATTFRASRTLPIFLCSLTAHTSLQKQIVGHQISCPHHMGGAATSLLMCGGGKGQKLS